MSTHTAIENATPASTVWRGKRAFDLIGAILLLIAAAPAFLLAVILIKLCSRGRLFFIQARVGQNETLFPIIKFRTMYEATADQETGAVSTRNDPRIFPGGRLLRKFKIDELPQLFNVLRGEMSLVGPRPTVQEDYERMDAHQRGRAAVPPGLTGLAQIRGGTSAPWPVRIGHDLEYIQRQSLWLDLRIISETAWLVLTTKADTHPPGDDEWN